MAKRTGRNLVKAPPLFLPDYPSQVKAIAMTGATDDEIAAAVGISSKLLASWKAYYPTLKEAIEEGRTQADARVLQALFDNAVGFEYEDEVVAGDQPLVITRRKLPETAAQRFWLENRNSRWRQSKQMQVALGGHPNLPPVKTETRQEVIASILNMIAPKADGDGGGGNSGNQL